jgi:hypothetical protein
MDGLSANDDAADLPGTFFSQEVIREFHVITSGGIAEFGRASSEVINVVSQSGANDRRQTTANPIRAEIVVLMRRFGSKQLTLAH